MLFEDPSSPQAASQDDTSWVRDRTYVLVMFFAGRRGRRPLRYFGATPVCHSEERSDEESPSSMLFGDPSSPQAASQDDTPGRGTGRTCLSCFLRDAGVGVPYKSLSEFLPPLCKGRCRPTGRRKGCPVPSQLTSSRTETHRAARGWARRGRSGGRRKRLPRRSLRTRRPVWKSPKASPR